MSEENGARRKPSLSTRFLCTSLTTTTTTQKMSSRSMTPILSGFDMIMSKTLKLFAPERLKQSLINPIILPVTSSLRH